MRFKSLPCAFAPHLIAVPPLAPSRHPFRSCLASFVAKCSVTDFGTFDVVSPALDFNYDRKMHDVRQIPMERNAFRDLLEALTMYGVVREYIKDLYIQWALVKLSRSILYAAVVALTLSGGMVVFVDPSSFPGTFLGIERVLWIVSGAFAISVLSFLLFTAYILRLARLAKQTLSMGQLMLS